MQKNQRVAVLVPCYNEALTIEKVVKDFRAQLPDAEIWVYDNNSTDGSGELAKAAGASVRHVRQQGKGHVVRRMFQEIEADVYVMVDADDTYPADEVKKLIQPILNGEADMVNGDRLSSTYMTENKRPGHNFGNTLMCALIRLLWGQRVHDVLTGYRAFSRLFVKTCPVLAQGFEIETEMTLHTLDKRMSLVEVPVQYRDRPKGSFSKLNTVSDGFRVLFTLFNLFRLYRPELFFGTVGGVLLLIAAGLFVPVLAEYFKTGLVPRIPTQIFSGFLAIAGLLSFGVGLILGACKKQSDQLFEILTAQEKGREVQRS